MYIADLIDTLEDIMDEIGPEADVRLSIESSELGSITRAEYFGIDYDVDTSVVWLEGQES